MHGFSVESMDGFRAARFGFAWVLPIRGWTFQMGTSVSVSTDRSVADASVAQHPSERGRHRNGFEATSRCPALALLLLLSTTGCGIEALPEPEAKPKAPTVAVPAAPRQASQARCEEMLKTVLEQVSPENVGLSTDKEAVVRSLRDWSNRCGGRQPTVPVPKAFLEALSDGDKETLNANRFNERDFDVLSEATLFRAVATVVTSRSPGDIERTAAVLAHVSRTVAAALPEAVDLPFTPSERYLVGVGSPRDRLAVFAGILRQLRIDVVVVDLAGKGAGAAPVLLAGVALDHGLALYDMELGVPLTRTPGATDEPPLTLKELQDQPDLLQGWGIAKAGPARIDPARLKDARLSIPGSAPQWSGRMQDLQAALAGDGAIVAADLLGDSKAGPGLLSRLAKASGDAVDVDSIGPWEYLASLAIARQRASTEQEKMLFFLTAAWGAPLQIEPDDQGQIKIIGPTRAFQRMRLAIAVGNHDEALAQLPQRVILPCRGSRALPLPNEVRYAHEDATNEASYWMGLVQYDLAEQGRGDFRVATDSAERYLRNVRDQFIQVAAGLAGVQLDRGTLMKLEKGFTETFANPGEGLLSDALDKSIGKTFGKPSNDAQRAALKFLESSFRRYGAVQLLKARSLAARNDRAAAIATLDTIPGRDPAAVEARFLKALWSPAREGDAPAAGNPPSSEKAVEKPESSAPVDAPGKSETPPAEAPEKGDGEAKPKDDTAPGKTGEDKPAPGDAPPKEDKPSSDGTKPE